MSRTISMEFYVVGQIPENAQAQSIGAEMEVDGEVRTLTLRIDGTPIYIDINNSENLRGLQVLRDVIEGAIQSSRNTPAKLMPIPAFAKPAGYIKPNEDFNRWAGRKVLSPYPALQEDAARDAERATDG